jgi:hypothetical protein
MIIAYVMKYDHCLCNENGLDQNQDNDWKRGRLRKESSDFMIRIYPISQIQPTKNKGE